MFKRKRGISEVHVTQVVCGRNQDKGLINEEFGALREYLQQVAGEPVYVDRCYTPTQFGQETYLYKGAAILVERPFSPFHIKGPQESVDTVVEEICDELGFKAKKKPK